MSVHWPAGREEARGPSWTLRLSEAVNTLGDALPQEQARVRDLLGEYRNLGPPGAFAALMLEAALREADEAAVSGDLARMIAAYKVLKGCE
jgi:hypothetical protein